MPSALASDSTGVIRSRSRTRLPKTIYTEPALITSVVRYHVAAVYGDHMSGSDWVFSVLWMVLALLLVAGVVWAITGFGRREQPVGGSSRSGREILDERLARGEIDTDEYDRLRGRLDSPTAPQNPTNA
jgi:putative membrane protein